MKQILPLLVLVVAAGCSSSSGGGTGPEDAANPDGTVDSSLDASSDALADTSDSSVLSDADAGVDVGVESLDAGTDADTRPDGGVEVGDSGPGGGLQWAENFGLAGYTNANAVALDPSSGDVVVVGYLNPNTSVNFGGGSLANATALSTDYTMFVAKFDSSGKYKWAKTFGNGLDVIAHSVGIDALGNVAIGGNFQGSVNFGGSTLTAAGDFDLFVVKFDAAGSFRWSKSFGAAGKSQVVNSVAVDGAGAVLFSGRGEAVDFGGGAKTGFYLAKLDSTGAHAWSNGFAATSVYSGPWLAVDTAGSAFLAGSFSTTVNFGGGTLTSAGATDAFVAKFDPSGAYQWAKQYGDSKAQSLSGVATDLAGDVFVSGDLTGGTIDFGTGPLVADITRSNIVLAKLGPSGSGIWADHFLGSDGSDVEARSLGVGGTGGPTMTCALYVGTMDFGGGGLAGSATGGTSSVGVASFDAAGRHRWSYSEGPPSTARTSFAAVSGGVAADATTVVLAGGFGSCASTCATSPPGTTFVLPSNTLTAVSANDIFLASFAP